MKREPVESESVVSIGYDASTLLLEVEFRGARLYQYSGVPTGIFEWLRRVPDKAAYINRMVARQYAYSSVCVPGPGSAAELEDALRRSLEANTGAPR